MEVMLSLASVDSICLLKAIGRFSGEMSFAWQAIPRAVCVPKGSGPGGCTYEHAGDRGSFDLCTSHSALQVRWWGQGHCHSSSNREVFMAVMICVFDCKDQASLRHSPCRCRAPRRTRGAE